ncbi:hypothetical protein ACP4OV_025334 [Aristida adscensionis]
MERACGGKMRCAAVALALLLYLSASTAAAHKEWLGDSAMLLAGRKWLRVRRIMAAPGHGVDANKDEVMEGKGGESTGANTVHVVHEGEKSVEVTVVGLGGEGAGRRSGGKRKFAGLVPFSADYRTPRTHPPRNNWANQEADAPAGVVNDQGRRSKASSASHVKFQEPRHGGDVAAVVTDMLAMDYKQLEARRHRPINNGAPLDVLAKRP